jgi:hypothetical protein
MGRFSCDFGRFFGFSFPQAMPPCACHRTNSQSPLRWSVNPLSSFLSLLPGL